MNISALKRFVTREDKEYDDFCDKYQAKTTTMKWFYIFMSLAPGIVAFILINVFSVYSAALEATGWSSMFYQGLLMFFVTYVWHMVFPMIMLRYMDGLGFKESLRFLGLHKFDTKGFFVVMPVIFVIFSFMMLPYYTEIAMPLREYVRSLDFWAMPEYSIFLGGPNGLYNFPGYLLFFLLIGNFFGEEIYYRGYLMKKTAFLGNWNWAVSSLLFGFYHFWQAEQTWPMFIPVMIFGLMMVWRKNIYVLIGFHALLNIALPWFRNFMDVPY